MVILAFPVSRIIGDPFPLFVSLGYFVLATENRLSQAYWWGPAAHKQMFLTQAILWPWKEQRLWGSTNVGSYSALPFCWMWTVLGSQRLTFLIFKPYSWCRLEAQRRQWIWSHMKSTREMVALMRTNVSLLRMTPTPQSSWFPLLQTVSRTEASPLSFSLPRRCMVHRGKRATEPSYLPLHSPLLYNSKPLEWILCLFP